MRRLPFDPAAPKRTIALILNGDLYAQAKAQGIDVSEAAEEALAQALTARLAEKIRAEIGQDIAAYDAYVDKHGSPAGMLRDYLVACDARDPKDS